MKEQQTLPPTAAPPAPRRPYAPPTAIFVPLKLEERLMGCVKSTVGLPDCFGQPGAMVS